MTGPVVPTHAFSQYTNPIIPELRIPYILDRNLRFFDGVSTNTNPGSVNNGSSWKLKEIHGLKVRDVVVVGWTLGLLRRHHLPDGLGLTCSIRLIETTNEAVEGQSLAL